MVGLRPHSLSKTVIFYNGNLCKDLVNIFSAEVNRSEVVAVRKLNEKIGGDKRVRAVMMNIGDGYTLATKL